jgi:hypothetical protein
LAKNLPNDGIQQKLAQFVLDLCDGLAFEAFVIAGKFVFPEFLDEQVFDLADIGNDSASLVSMSNNLALRHRIKIQLNRAVGWN